MNKNSSWETSVKPVVVLSVIALIVSLLLAMVNSFTAPIIEENQKAATLAAYVDVMPTVSSASDLEEVTVDTNGTVTGIWVDASTQTKGIGSNVATDSFLAQFDGMDGTQNITLGQGYDAYSGATISSKALFAAINDCINCYNELA